MFPWLNPDKDNYGQLKQNLQQDRKDSGVRIYRNNSFKQNQADLGIIKGQKQYYREYDQENDKKYDEKEYNAYTHSKSDNRLNQDKYNPYYDNMFSHNLKKSSRSGRIQIDERNQQTPKSPIGGAGINFEQDYKHRILDQNKKSYKDYYRDNVSQFQKNKQGNHQQTNEEKKVRLQNVYQPENEQGIVGRMPSNQRNSQSPQQKQQEYANILKRQIEEKKELIKQQQRREEDNDFQNKNQRNDRDNYHRNERDNYSEDRQLQEQYENKKSQNKKNVGFEDYEEYSSQNNRKEYRDFDKDYQRDYSSPQKYQQQQNDQRGNYYNQIDKDDQYSSQRNRKDSGKDYNSPPNQKKSILRNNSQDEYSKNEKRRWDDGDNFDKNLLGRMHDNNEREQQIKKEKEIKYYKQLEEEIGSKRGRRDNSEKEEKDNPWNKNEKSMLEQIGDNYKRQKELHLQQQADIAQELQQQIKDKKRQQRLEKEKQDLIDRQDEERVRAEVEQLKVKYQHEMKGKQLEIKSLRKNIEKKKQEQIQQQGELVLSKSPKPVQRGRVDNSPRMINNQKNDGESNGQNQRESAQDIDLQSNRDKSQNDIQSRDYRQKSRHESSRQQQRDNLYKNQHEYYQNREVNQEWNPPSFWQYRERKNNEELSQLKDKLDMQTSLLQNEALRIKQDTQVANEMKSQALIDLEKLKDTLRRQNMIDNVKLRELRQNMGTLGYAQNDNSQMQNVSGLGGSQNIPNQSIFQQTTIRNINNNNSNNLLNQSSFSQNPNYSQLGNSNIYNNNFNTNKYGIQQPDILDKLISTNLNSYRFEGSRLNNQPATLDFKLEQRLNNINLNKAEIQLLEVDNLLNNIRYGL